MNNSEKNNEIRKVNKETKIPDKRTIEEVATEIKKTIDIDLVQETMLTRLRNKGFEVEKCWVKNGNIGDIYYMKRKHVYRIQVSESEPYGKFQKADCVILPVNDVAQPAEKTKIRNLHDKKKLNK